MERVGELSQQRWLATDEVSTIAISENTSRTTSQVSKEIATMTTMDTILSIIYHTVFAVSLLGIVYYILLSASQFRRYDRVKIYRAELEREFPRAKVYVSYFDTSFLVVDFEQCQIVVGLRESSSISMLHRQPYRTLVSFADLVGAKISTKTRLTGARIREIMHMTLRLIIRDLNRPIHDVTFFGELSNDRGFFYSRRKRLDACAIDITEFINHLLAAFLRADTGTSVIDHNDAPSLLSENKLSRQIMELWDQKEEGSLTHDNYDTLMGRLLGA